MYTGFEYVERVAGKLIFDLMSKRTLGLSSGWHEIEGVRLQFFRDGEKGPVLTRVEAWRPAIPQYVVGHGALKSAASALETANPGFFLSGNLLHGVSVGNCIQNATGVAERTAAFLTG